MTPQRSLLPLPVPACRWRGRPLAEDRFVCTSAKLVVGSSGVGRNTCAKCYCADHEPLKPEEMVGRQALNLRKVDGRGLSADARPFPPVPQPPGFGPGTELKNLLASLGILPDGCQCKARAVQMDGWGISGCQERRAEIIEWLNEQQTKLGWWAKVRAAALGLSKGLIPTDLNDLAGWLLDEALRRAEADTARRAAQQPNEQTNGIDGGGGALLPRRSTGDRSSVPAPSPSVPSSATETTVRKPNVWTCGLTCVPERKGKLLPNTLASLQRAGFPKPVLFADGVEDGPALARELAALSPWFAGLRVVGRYPRIRLFGNFILGLAELYIREPFADRYAMFQDDVAFSANVRPYLDQIPFPADGYLNLYTVPENQRLAPKGYGPYRSNQKGKGALALVFDRDAVQKLLTTSDHIVSRPTAVGIRSWRNIDGGIVDALTSHKKFEYVHSPSLCQHAGHVSTIGTAPAASATSVRGEGFDCLTLLSSSLPLHQPATPRIDDRVPRSRTASVTTETSTYDPIAAKLRESIAENERRLATATGRGRMTIQMRIAEAKRRLGVA